MVLIMRPGTLVHTMSSIQHIIQMGIPDIMRTQMELIHTTNRKTTISTMVSSVRPSKTMCRNTSRNTMAATMRVLLTAAMECMMVLDM